MARRKRVIIVLFLLAAVAAAAILWYRRPRPLAFPDYALDVRLPAAAALAASLRAGFGSADITPAVGPGARPVFMAGFDHDRRANGVHDPLFARAVVLDDGRTRIGLVALDLIGLFHDETVRIRRALPAAFGLDYVAVACLHNHEGPDTMGLWGPSVFRSGADPIYLAHVREAAIDALRRAVADLAPARLIAAEADTAAEDLIRDSRPPRVIDARLLALRFEDPAAPAGAGAPARGTLVLWSNHPETLGSRNRKISSDFPDAVRRAVERDGGGPCVYLSGSIGGLMTPLHQAIRGIDGRVQEGETFEKAQALGEVVARRVRDALASPGALRVALAPLGARARLVDVEARNGLFWAAMKIGVIDRGLAGPSSVRTEVGAVRIGPVALALVPGELYPEIAAGGVESPPGADFPGEPVEVPPLRALLARNSDAGTLGGIVGLANDEVGYVIPRTQWDALPPFTYGQSKAPYGEVNSLGPAAAPSLHRALAQVIGELPR